jgi:AcrR family transcriptional regulator
MAKAVRRKRKRYHHGQLRQALIDAAHQLINQYGPEGFSLAKACRVAGVSTAAPYRHFADRGALVEAVASSGFAWLRERTEAARDQHHMGSVESIVAMAKAYVAFAADEPAVFKLMFGRHPDVQPEGEAHVEGAPCFEVLLDAVDAWIERSGAPVDHTLDVALPLWTIVHGTAYLLIDHDFDAVAPGTDTDRLVERAAVAFLRGLSA